jgi:uncharacterized RDD family membrane protein YckC
MKCAACGWSNPASYTHCFSCNVALSGSSAAAPSPSSAQSTPQKKTPWDPRTAPKAEANIPRSGKQTAGQGTVADDDVAAGKLQRLFAAGIDLVLMAVLGGISIAALVGFGASAAEGESLGLPVLIAAVLAVAAILLPALMDSFSAGSIGKRLLNLRVINARGERPGLIRSKLRHIIKYVSHFVLPLGLFLVEKIFFGGRSLHDLLMSTRVIDRRSSARQIDQIVATEFGPTAVGSAFKIVAWVALACAALAFGVVAIGAFTATPNPTRDAAGALSKTAKSLAKQSENYFYAQSAFPAQLGALGLSKLPDEFASVQFNETNGAFTLTLSDKVLPELKGKSLTLFPEFKQKKGAGTIKKWRCGSKDIARDDQPFGCKDDVTVIN